MALKNRISPHQENYLTLLERRLSQNTPFTQSERILRKFGGPKSFWRLTQTMGYTFQLSTIWRWTCPKRYNGIIPPKAIPVVLEVARYYGIYLSSEDWDPRPVINRTLREIDTENFIYPKPKPFASRKLKLEQLETNR